MARPLAEIGAMALYHGCPIIYAGDVFDRWNAGPEVINFALANLPSGWAIPGQHDLPNHNYDEIKRSAYWTLVEAGLLKNLEPYSSWKDGCVMMTGFPWGFPLTSYPDDFRDDGEISIAVAHSFIWTPGTGYEGAPIERMVGGYRKVLAGYDVAVFGDNHKGFIVQCGEGPWVINCGTLMRRTRDERNYQPSVGLLHEDGTVTRHFLDVSEDRFVELTEAEETVEEALLDMTEFVSGLKALSAGDALDFRRAISRFLDKNEVSSRVRELVLQACEGRTE